jgi:hypothetical protein
MIPMKRFAVGLLAVVLPFAAHAEKNSQTVVLTQTVQVGSAKLPAGPLKVSWTGTGSDAQLTLAPNGKNPITVPAQLIAERHNQPGVGTVSVNGVQYLQELELNNVKVVVQNPETVAVNTSH